MSSHRDRYVFLGLWLLYGVLIDSGDLTAFNLQQLGVEAIVERGVFFVEGSPTPQLQPGGDVFEYNGHLYAAKQPGQFMAGALIYFFLHRLGISYFANFLLAAALVTFFTASLATAAAGVCVHRLARSGVAPGSSAWWPWLATLSFAVGSTALPYSGVEHHDALATAYVAIAFYLVVELSGSLAASSAHPSPLHALLATSAGFLLGWTITTSMLPFFMVVVVTLYFLSLRAWPLVPWLALGSALGLTPLFFYNAVNFGHPFLVPNIAGSYRDTFFFLDWHNFTGKVRFYTTMISLYVPIFWCGLGGLAFFPARLRHLQIALVALVVVLLGYVLNIETLAGCQYGPRYLLPAMPYAALGIVGLSHLSGRSVRTAAALVVGVVLSCSAIINLVGALYGTMYCDLRRYAFLHYLDAIRHDVFRTFPLALWLIVPLGLWMVGAVAAAERHRRGKVEGGTLPPVKKGGRGGFPALATLVTLVLYVVALNSWRDTVPAGLNNDAAEEALRGIHLVEAKRFEVLSASVGIPQETLYLAVVAGVAKLIGATTLAIHVVSWAAALGCIALLVVVVRGIDAAMPRYVPLLLAGSSIWLFHYARAGVRAISAPLCALAVCALLDRAERASARVWPALAGGAVLGLSLYTYTSCRVLVIAFALYAATRLWRGREHRRRLARCYGWVTAGALAASIPSLLSLLDAPRAFLLRGSYVLFGGWAAVPGHLLWSALLPFHYADRYRALTGPTHIFDGVSAGLAAAGINPLHPIAAAALLLGVIAAWRRRAAPAVSFLSWLWLVGVLLLGPAGPSLTRLLILLPGFLTFAALGLAALHRRRPHLGAAIAAALLVLLAFEAHAYFVTFAGSPEAQRDFSPVATPLGQRARELARQGKRVICVLSKDANVVNYLAHDYAGLVRVVEFYRRPFHPREIPVAGFQPQVLLVERSARFLNFLRLFPVERHIGTHPAFDEIRVD